MADLQQQLADALAVQRETAEQHQQLAEVGEADKCIEPDLHPFYFSSTQQKAQLEVEYTNLQEVHRSTAAFQATSVRSGSTGLFSFSQGPRPSPHLD